MKKFNINPVDRSIEATVKEKIDNLTKPKGALGLLEELACTTTLNHTELEIDLINSSVSKNTIKMKQLGLLSAYDDSPY